MEQQITVYDENNHRVGQTFQRRAKQMVGKNRATWLDENAIRLTPAPSPKEDETMAHATSVFQNNNGPMAPDMPDTPEAGSFYDKAHLLALAKKNVKAKRNLFRHLAAYFAALLFILIISAAGGLDWYSANFIAGVFTAWSVFIASRVLGVLIPRVKASLSIKSTKQDPVAVEYMRLKNMAPDRIAIEYERP